MNISIFARPYFIGDDPLLPMIAPHLHRGSSLIRGEQVAEYIGAKYNPTSGYENDVCIYLKPKRLDKIKDGAYVDVCDIENDIVERLQDRPKIKVIAGTLPMYEFLKEKLKNDVVFIPEHHCNFERVQRSRKEITIGGFVGAPNSFTYPVDEMTKRLEEIGIKFMVNYTYKNRQDVVDFYKQIDMQIIWYPNEKSFFKYPTKLISAASFGIPTICSWHAGYKGFEGNYIPVETIDSLIAEVEKMKNKDYYDQWSNKIVQAAEDYHIDNIAEKYKQLK